MLGRHRIVVASVGEAPLRPSGDCKVILLETLGRVAPVAERPKLQTQLSLKSKSYTFMLKSPLLSTRAGASLTQSFHPVEAATLVTRNVMTELIHRAEGLAIPRSPANSQTCRHHTHFTNTDTNTSDCRLRDLISVAGDA